MAILPVPFASTDVGTLLCLGCPDVHCIDGLPSLALLSSTDGSGMVIRNRVARNTEAKPYHLVADPTAFAKLVLRQSSFAAHLFR